MKGRQRLLQMIIRNESYGNGEKGPSPWTIMAGNLIIRKRDPEDSAYMNTRPKGWAEEQCACHLWEAHGQCQPAWARPSPSLL